MTEERREVSPEERRRRVILGRGVGDVIVRRSGVGGSRWAGDAAGEQAQAWIPRSRV